jgi:hypothetical protein
MAQPEPALSSFLFAILFALEDGEAAAAAVAACTAGSLSLSLSLSLSVCACAPPACVRALLARCTPVPAIS